MKKAKVVNQANKQSRALIGKRAVLLTLGAVAALGTVSVVVPTSNIPGFKYIAQVLGIGADATRDLTMSDFASYAIGVRGNKIESLRDANSLSYSVNGDSIGGLSPFSTFDNDRLAQAYAENSKTAIAIEKSFGGQITPFDKSTINRDITYDPALLAKGFDPTKISASAQAAQSGAMEALAAAAGKQAEAFGKPVKQKDLDKIASIIGVKDGNLSNIVGTGNIMSLANKDEMLYDRVKLQAKALAGTSIFGSINPDFTRTDTRIGRPIYGLFRELGNSYFFSRYAKGAKYSTAAEDIAIAAFDGGSPQDQSIITHEDTAHPGASGNPQQALNQGAQAVNACQQMKSVYNQTLSSQYGMIQEYKRNMKNLSNAFNNTETPGSCYGQGNNRNVKIARDQWNTYVDSIKEACDTMRDINNQFANQCGIVIAQPAKSCSKMAQALKLAHVKKAHMIVKCRRISLFGSTGEANIKSSKLRKWDRRYRHYINNDYTPEEAEVAADQDVDIDMDDIEGVDYKCNNKTNCWNYFDNMIEQGFAFGNITDITSLPNT
jgi:hypothetical protein